MADLDDALARFQLCALELPGGPANCGPMAAEALCRLGHPALIGGLVDVYAPRLPPLEAGSVIPPAAREAALGDAARLQDWVSTFDREIRDRSPGAVLADWIPRLLPGLFAGGGFGLLRVAHAVRALAETDSPARRRELGLGLAYWASRFVRLPGLPSSRLAPGTGVAECFRAVPALGGVGRRPDLPARAVLGLGPAPELAAVVAAFDPARTPTAALLGEAARASARLYLESPARRIAYVQCLAVPSALRLIAGQLPDDVVRCGFGFALQTALALHAVARDGSPAPSPDPETERVARDAAEIRYRAACSLDEHAILFSEACLREHELDPDPVFLLAAADAALRLDSGAGRGATA